MKNNIRCSLHGYFFAAICFLSFVPSANAAVVDSQVWSGNGHTYYLLAPAAWSDSEAEAVSLGGHLATINDQAEHDWVWNTFVSFIPPNPPATLGNGGLWIGYTDSEVFGTSEGDWVWVSGESSSYTNWYPGEPNNAPGNDPSAGGEDFAFLWVVNNGQWLDANNTGSGNWVSGVVEVETVPLPASVWLFGSGLIGLFRFMRRR